LPLNAKELHMKAKFLLAALIATLTTSFAVIAADPPAKETAAPAEKPAKAEPAKKKMKRHSHVEAKGSPAPAEAGEMKDQPKRPPHDHLKEKGM